MNIRVISRYKAQLRQNAQRWIARLAKSNRGDYIAQYHERVLEIYQLQKKLWEIINNDKIAAHNHVEAAGKLLDCSKQLVALYDCLPMVNAIRDYDHDHDDQDHNYKQDSL
jgi:hypothetical protein